MDLSAIATHCINIDSVLQNVTQSIDAAPALDPAQQSELKSLVTELQGQIGELKAEHEAECQEITAALEKAVAEATKEKAEDKPADDAKAE